MGESLNGTIGGALRALDELASNERVRLVPYRNEFFDDHLKLKLANYPAPTKLLTSTEYGMKCYRELQLKDKTGITLIVLDRASDAFVGELVVHDFDAKPWEIGWDVLPEYQGMGYATAAARVLINRLKDIPEYTGIIARMDADNGASIRVARKLGGVPAGTETTAIARSLGVDGLERFVAEHNDLVTDEVRSIAEEFSVEPEDLLTRVVVFKLI